MPEPHREHHAHRAVPGAPTDDADRLHHARARAAHRLARQRRTRTRRALRGTFSIALVMALAGALFTANARISRGTDARQPQDLAGLQTNEDARRERLADRVADLRSQVDALTEEQTGTVGLEWQTAGQAYDIASGKVAVSGRGITVTLDDAPADGPRPAGTGPDDLVVHQQDLQAVINALWAGGAEAMALMDQRVISTSAFQCIGNVLSLQGRRYSPPYVVTAVGDPAELLSALDADPAVRAYRSWVDVVGLGWEVSRPTTDLDVPAYDGAVDMRYASVPPGTEVLPGLVSGDSTATQARREDGRG
ncbi:DUF881 domain-containing protein [Cellulomonas triticagri]|nr:DUF881 domain-containing protein [Cellulomonas triticagri]